MQTPADPHWRDQGTRVSKDTDDERRREIAREYLAACHAVGLQVIGVTDHNLGRPGARPFVEDLRQANREDREAGRPSLVILPGFEVEANVGKGCHVLCLFPPDTPIEVVDSRLTALDLPPDRRFDDDTPRPTKHTLSDIIDVIQRSDTSRGLVVAAHPTSTNGLFDNDSISEWLQREEFTNPELLCLEVPKPPSAMSSGWQRLLGNGPDCDDAWRRARSIACVMSSDCYRMSSVEGESGNYIGHRFTWIRMTDPSIEALRQAFLDHESRISLREVSPDASSTHARVTRVSVTGMTFLRRTEPIEFSPNLNCVIGSRGTGKSSLMDYVRHALDRVRDSDIAPGIREEVRERIRETATPAARIEVDLATAGGSYRVVCSGRQLDRSIQSLDPEKEVSNLDVRTLFPCRFLSQREIDQSFGKRDREAMRHLLDGFISPTLRDLAERAESLQNQISAMDTSLYAIRSRQSRRLTLETEVTDLRGQLDRQQQLNAVLPEWNQVEGERRALEQARSDNALLLERLEELVRDLDRLPEDLGVSSQRDEFLRAQSRVAAARRSLRDGLQALRGTFQSELGADSEYASALASWATVRDDIRVRFDAARLAAPAQPADAPDPASFPDRILAIEAQLDRLAGEQAELVEIEADRAQLVEGLRAIWREETEQRRMKAQQIMTRLRPPASESPPLVEITVHHQADVEAFVEALMRQVPDRRRLNEPDLRVVADHLVEEGREDLLGRFIAAAAEEGMPWIAQVLDARRLPAFTETFTADVLHALEVTRIPDIVEYMVYRADGTPAGPIEKVSAGQQGTAILNVLLAEGTDPLIIDTPEEGLDSEGVYAELVPLFRREKGHRQIVVVTHNANIPVNADAECIVALDACGFVPEADVQAAGSLVGDGVDSKVLASVADSIRHNDWQRRVESLLDPGIPDEAKRAFVSSLTSKRQAESRVRLGAPNLGPARGGLDRPAVKSAVQDVMEGSADAFRRRREMYGY